MIMGDISESKQTIQRLKIKRTICRFTHTLPDFSGQPDRVCLRQTREVFSVVPDQTTVKTAWKTFHTTGQFQIKQFHA